ncbi:meiosis protein mei2 [Pseudoloma neurophilia]|uniref:Meiosis protein mei2 n=1 Tax=Pseudoloma neurophilia TaxID=146866 RepID=A0A0R0M1S5_9MICR|nr:meiosis protein mei2 [Pseudoloma neurophilia]
MPNTNFKLTYDMAELRFNSLPYTKETNNCTYSFPNYLIDKGKNEQPQFLNNSQNNSQFLNNSYASSVNANLQKQTVSNMFYSNDIHSNNLYSTWSVPYSYNAIPLVSNHLKEYTSNVIFEHTEYSIQPTENILTIKRDSKMNQEKNVSSKNVLSESKSNHKTILSENVSSKNVSSENLLSKNVLSESKSNHKNLLSESKSESKSENERTTVMLKNIPNKYNCDMLLDMINEYFWGQYDFIYLRMDFFNNCNVGYAFINFLSNKNVIDFYNIVNKREWKLFTSNKIAEVTYASIQGIEKLYNKFKTSSLISKKKYRPRIFYKTGVLKGMERETFSID